MLRNWWWFGGVGGVQDFICISQLSNNRGSVFTSTAMLKHWDGRSATMNFYLASYKGYLGEDKETLRYIQKTLAWFKLEELRPQLFCYCKDHTVTSLSLTADFFLSARIGKYHTVIFVTVLLKDPEMLSCWRHTLRGFPVPGGIYTLKIQENGWNTAPRGREQA